MTGSVKIYPTVQKMLIKNHFMFFTVFCVFVWKHNHQVHAFWCQTTSYPCYYQCFSVVMVTSHSAGEVATAFLTSSKKSFLPHTVIGIEMHAFFKCLTKYICFFLFLNQNIWECSGSVAECLTRDRVATGSSFTALCPSVRHIYPSLILVQHRKTCPYITERLLMGHKNQNKQTTITYVFF